MELDRYVEEFEAARSRDDLADLRRFAPAPEHALYLPVLRELVRSGVQVPLRPASSPDKGQLSWRRPSQSALQNMLSHPAYAGAYVYGRSSQSSQSRRQKRPCRLPRMLSMMVKQSFHLPQSQPTPRSQPLARRTPFPTTLQPLGIDASTLKAARKKSGSTS